MNEYKITEEILQATINYLATRPYQEIFKLIAELQKLEPVEQDIKK